MENRKLKVDLDADKQDFIVIARDKADGGQTMISLNGNITILFAELLYHQPGIVKSILKAVDLNAKKQHSELTDLLNNN